MLAGEWECSKYGCWDFVAEKNCLSQCIMIEEEMSYLVLKRHIEKEFEGVVKGSVGRMSYWPPREMSIFSYAKTPPVSINSDAGLVNFFKLHAATKGLTLLVSFVVNGASNCVSVAEKSGCNDRGEVVGEGQTLLVDSDDIVPTTQDVALLISMGVTDDVMGESRLTPIDDDAARGDNGLPVPIAEYSGQREGVGRIVDDSGYMNGEIDVGVICLDDGTPSLNSPHDYGSVERGEDRVEELVKGGEMSGIDLNSIYNAEVVAQLEVIENMATEAQGLQNRDKGKGKVISDADVIAYGGTSQEWNGNGEGDDDRCDFRFWEAVINEEYRKRMDGTRMEVGEASNAGVGQCEGETEAAGMVHLGALSPCIEEDSSGGELEAEGMRDTEGSDVDSEFAEGIQLSLANIYNDIIEADVVPSHDCPPCFGEELVQTQEMRNRVYDSANDAIFIGRVFRNKADMQTALAIYAIKRFFNFKQIRSDRNRLIVRCVDMNCAWRVYGHTMGWNSETMEVRTATLTHTCDVTTRAEYGKKATCKVIAEVLKSKFANGKLGPRAVDIPDLVLEELSVSITYMKAWHAKEKAEIEARGSAAGSYKLLMAYLHLLKQTNPGTVATVVSRANGTENCKFKYLFFAFGACVHAVQFMRKVIVIDATAIKAKFRGCLLTASFQDGNFQIIPLGFGVVDGENETSWTWFFKQLSTIVPDARDLVFVSDRHSSIYAALRAVYPLAQHGVCVVHLYRNVKSRFNRNRGLAYLVTQAACAYTVGEFRAKFTEIERRSPLCANYLRGIGISHWTRVYFQGKRYNLMSSNAAESLNAALAKALEFPIVSMVETIRMMLMRWFNCRRAKASKHTSEVTPEVEDLLMQRLSESGNLKVAAASATIFQVSTVSGRSFTVDLQRRSCSCKVFETQGIPCCHALAASRAGGVSITDMVDEYYKVDCWRSAYSAVVMPVPDAEDMDVPQEVLNSCLLPPQSSQPAGRPRKRRIPSRGEERVKLYGNN